MNYSVPNFGEDHDIIHTVAHTKSTEAKLKHNWVPKKDDDDNWVVPKTTTEFRLNENESAGNFNFVQNDRQNVQL